MIAKICEGDQSSFASISQTEVTDSAIDGRIYVILRDFLLTNRRYGRCPMSVPIHYYCRRHYVVTSYSDVTIHQAHTNDLDNLITSASEI